MKLLIIFINNTKPSVDLVWNKSLSSILLSNNACLVSIDSTEPSILRLHSINHMPNTTSELKGLTSLDQLASRAHDFTGSIDFDDKNVMFWLHDATPSSINGVSLSGDKYSFHHYKVAGDINVTGSERKTTLNVDDSKLADIGSAASYSVFYKKSKKISGPYQPINKYPREFNASLERKEQLEKEVAGCWLCKSNKARVLVELDFWKVVFRYRDTNPFASLRACVEYARQQFEDAETYTKVVHGRCCKTKSWSIINTALNEEHDPERVSLLEMSSM